MPKASKTPPLTPEEKIIIHQMKSDLIEMGITNPKDQLPYIQQELEFRREKQQGRRDRSQKGFMGAINRLRDGITNMGSGILKRTLLKGQNNLDDNPEELDKKEFDQFLKEMGIDSVEDLDIVQDPLLIGAYPHRKRREVFFDDEEMEK